MRVSLVLAVSRQFHDTVMPTASLPVELVRASLTTPSLPSGFRATWRFDRAN